MSAIVVRPATPADAAGMARVHVQAWQETYRGQAPDEVLDASDFVERRERMWNRTLDDADRGTRAAVAEIDGEIVGIALAGPAQDTDSPHDWQLYVLYLLTAHHGSGAGQQLLDEVLTERASVLWVADPNPRAQAFYARNGFAADGAAQGEAPREIRMVRAARSRALR
ncbi:GNAT family N-acetyltransferase [Gryllotalpicola protaetiae]|uniref:GNAT family N-acetyltransferase n=1 Tax=Gryllotalpicola protaetiae TaxID=2419771 RepID=A0A387BG69_9MICO|nr:GNAT family N-acetyltransferase [Gryllotalpicola protaetiae]AYG03035.1 GNAT family N-acetyltransferase [Gryllotalpicola protaetiae]